jgi:hypothetical protein
MSVKKLKYFTYGFGPLNYSPEPGSVEYDYYHFTEKNSEFYKVNFDGETFDCYIANPKEFSRLKNEGKIVSTYDNGLGKVYQVNHKLM